MSSRPLSKFPEEWGLTEQTHDAVVARLGDKIGLDFFDKSEEFVQNTKVDTGTYMKALRDVDGRKWHDRVIDALVQWNLDGFEASEYELLLRDINHYYTEVVDPGKDDVYYDQPLKKGDLDFARLSVLDDKLKVEVYEVKTHEEDLLRSNQLEEVSEMHERVSYETGASFEVVTREMLPTDVSTLLDQVGDSHGVPHKYFGLAHYTDESKEVLEDSQEFQAWRNHFLANDELGLDGTELLEEVRREEFLY